MNILGTLLQNGMRAIFYIDFYVSITLCSTEVIHFKFLSKIWVPKKEQWGSFEPAYTRIHLKCSDACLFTRLELKLHLLADHKHAAQTNVRHPQRYLANTNSSFQWVMDDA